MSEAEVVPGFGDIGARLRAARERSGMTSAQAAERLHCDRGLVESLEAGRFAQIGAPVFVRGHLRRYAELLGEPVGEILERWEREAAGHLAQPDITQIPKAKRLPNTRRLLVPAAAVALVALFALLISWVLRDAPPLEIGVFASRPAAEAPIPSASPDVAAAPPGPSGAVVGSGGPLTAEDAQPVTADGALSIRAAEDCWIEIYDAERGRLYFNLLRAGSSTTVRGRMPLRMLLGNVRGVMLEFDGRPLSVPAQLQRANTASVLLGADGALQAAPRD